MNSKGKTGGLIFSRFDSSRLPGKALVMINGRQMLGRVVDRARKIKKLDSLVIATTVREVDDPIVEFAKNEGCEYYRGGLSNVAMRALAACQKFHISKFVRICGDRPFFEPLVISKLLELHTNNVDVATTTFPRTYPPGLTGEVISTDALNRIFSYALEEEDKEHVTHFFYRNPELFTIASLPAPNGIDFSGVKLVVDDIKDLKRAQWIAEGVDKQGACTGDMGLVIKLAREWDVQNKLLVSQA